MNGTNDESEPRVADPDNERLASRIPGPETTLQSMLGDKKAWIDGIITPLLFLGTNSFFGLGPAIAVSAAWGVSLLSFRLIRRQKPAHAIGGLIGMGIALLIVVKTGRATAYFLPNVVFGVLYGTVGILSIVVGRPLSAAILRVIERRPKEWYREPRVRTTHIIVTTVWSLFLVGRSGIRYYLISIDSEQGLAITAVALGLPATAALVVASWAFMKRRLARIQFLDQSEANPDC